MKRLTKPLLTQSWRNAFAFVFVLLITPTALAQQKDSSVNWEQLPSIPDQLGVAGAFAGVSGGALIIAGGANFPDAMPWEGGKKVWRDSIFVLREPNGEWSGGFKLPRPLGYGVSITTDDGIICIGGSDSHQHFRDVFALHWKNGMIQTTALPSLPRPMANGCGALLGKTIYVTGGTEKPDATNAMKTFWALDLSEKNPHWRELEPPPGPARILAVPGVLDGAFFLFSGAELFVNEAGKTDRRYLKDAYRFDPETGWNRIADLPRPVVAAPSPAFSHDGKLWIVSGDDGALVHFKPESKHPGFPKDVLAYDPHKNEWKSLADSPLSRATAPVVNWRGKAVILSGEARPGRRTPEVWEMNFQ